MWNISIKKRGDVCVGVLYGIFHSVVYVVFWGFQYQFDGNSNLVYTIIRKRQVFHALANLPSDCNTIAKSLSKRQRRHMPASTSNENVSETAMEGSHPAQPAEPGTLKASLLETPGEYSSLCVVSQLSSSVFFPDTVYDISYM